MILSTGMKCLPRDKVPKAQGIVIHDWHAETLAIRSFNRFLLEECLDLAMSRKPTSEYISFRSNEEKNETHFQPFALKDGLKLHMYCSEAPCTESVPFLFHFAYTANRWRCKYGNHHGSTSRLHSLGRSIFSGSWG